MSREPSQEQVMSACFSFNRDFGLLSEIHQSVIMFAAYLWYRAWDKAGGIGQPYNLRGKDSWGITLDEGQYPSGPYAEDKRVFYEIFLDSRSVGNLRLTAHEAASLRDRLTPHPQRRIAAPQDKDQDDDR